MGSEDEHGSPRRAGGSTYDLQQLVFEADRALYRAKAMGRDTFVLAGGS